MEVLNISKKELQINEEIKDKEVRVISQTGSQLGLLKLEEALKAAYDVNLDLVKIAPLSKPPVCKIMDYGKYKFEQTKKDKETRKNQKTIEIKEIRLTINIGENDFNTKVKSAIKFLKTGNKVKVAVRFKGRELARTASGYEILEKFQEACSEYGFAEKPSKLENRNIVLFLAPKLAESKK